VRCGLGFSLGILVHEAWRSRRLLAIGRSDAAFLLALGWILVGTSRYAPDVWILPGFAALLWCAAHNRGGVARLLNTRALLRLGEISYSIYLVNLLLFECVHFAWRVAGLGAFGRGLSLGVSWCVWLAAMALVIALAGASYERVEKPAREWLRARGPRATRSPQPAPSLAGARPDLSPAA
jgi:peptidoglycan/LPS O-acetylase OafA/YrhL